MTADEVHSRLSQLTGIDIEIKSLYHALEESKKITSEYAAATSQPVTRNKSFIMTADDVLKDFQQVQEHYLDRIRQLLHIKQETLALIDLLSESLSRTIVIEHFINGLTLERVAETVHYSDRHVRLILSDAYQDISSQTNGDLT